MGGRICDTRIVVDVLATRDGWMGEEEKKMQKFSYLEPLRSLSCNSRKSSVSKCDHECKVGKIRA